MAHAVIGLYDSQREAREVEQDLIFAGIAQTDIRVTSEHGAERGGGERGTDEGATFWDEIKEMFSSDSNAHHAEYYAEGTRRGGTLVTVLAPEDRIEAVAEIFRVHHAVDIDSRAAEWGRAGWAGYRAVGTATPIGAAHRDNVSAPVIEQQLQIAACQADGRGVRVIRRGPE